MQVSKEAVSLAQRRAELIELCALQRGFLAEEVAALKTPFGGAGVGGFVAANKPVVLAVAGVALGLAVTRPKRVLKLAAAGLSLWKVAQKVLPLLARPGSQA
ncbi:hypothetical protein GCM10027318_02110 [Massilia agilis]